MRDSGTRPLPRTAEEPAGSVLEVAAAADEEPWLAVAAVVVIMSGALRSA